LAKEGKHYEDMGQSLFFWFSGEGTLKYWNTKAASAHVNKNYSMSKIKHFKRFLKFPSQFFSFEFPFFI
jgi:hypothetical protein